jgi:hypothetical protein
MDAESQLLAELRRQIKDLEEAIQRQDNGLIENDTKDRAAASQGIGKRVRLQPSGTFGPRTGGDQVSEDPFPGSSADFYEQIQILKAEIGRLKTINSSRTFLYLEARSLIAELCDALDKAATNGSFELIHERNLLLKRAREVTK